MLAAETMFKIDVEHDVSSTCCLKVRSPLFSNPQLRAAEKGAAQSVLCPNRDSAQTALRKVVLLKACTSEYAKQQLCSAYRLTWLRP